MKDEVIIHFLKLLKSILDSSEKKLLIKQFQEEIWDNTESDEVFEKLSELAYDMDFYEPSLELRKEDPSFFSDERLKTEVEHAIELLLSILNKKESS